MKKRWKLGKKRKGGDRKGENGEGRVDLIAMGCRAESRGLGDESPPCSAVQRRSPAVSEAEL